MLAEGGRDVVVLEEGGNYTEEDFNQRDGQMYDQLYMDRGGRATSDLSVSVLQGRVLGGGPVINACDVVPMPAGVRDHWRRRFGLTDLSDAALAPHLNAALEDLGANPIPDDMVNSGNALLRKGAETLGLRGEVMHHNRDGCAELGTCLIGCPVAAKQSIRTVSLPKAIDDGARIYVRTRALRIERTGNAWRVICKTLDPKGYHEQHDAAVKCRQVVVAANAIASAQLLLRSGLGNEHVGRNLILQPQLPLVARFPDEVRAFEGIPQSYAITQHEIEDHPEHGLWGFRIEGIMGTPGIVSTMLPFQGVAGKEMMTHYAHLAASLLLVPDRPGGTVGLHDDGRPDIRYTQADDHKARLREAIAVGAKAYLAAGAVEVVVPTARPLRITKTADLAAVADLDFSPATAPLISAHQQGTARMAPSAKDGALDPTGRLWGEDGIYVFDSSGFPSSASSHTMTPIVTLSRYWSAALLARNP